jgi:hypothetical protein
MLWVCRDREGFVLPVADVLLIAGSVRIHVLLVLLPVVIHSQLTHVVRLLILLILSGVLHGGGIMV